MSINFFTKKVILPITVVIVLLNFSLLVNAVTFTSETYVEISPAIRGTVCIMSGNTCVTGSEKQIIFGLASIWPTSAKEYRATELPLILFDGQMFQGVSGGKGASPNSWEWTMSTLNLDGTEIKDTAEATYTINLKTGSLSDLTLVVSSETYTLTSVEEVIKMEGTALSDDFTTSSNLLKMSLYVNPSQLEIDLDTSTVFGVDFEYSLVGLGDATAILDYGDGTSDVINPVIQAIKNHKYQNEGVYAAFIKVNGVVSSSVEINVQGGDVRRSLPSFEITGIELSREYNSIPALGQIFTGPLSTNPPWYIIACVWDSASQRCAETSDTTISGPAPLDVIFGTGGSGPNDVFNFGNDRVFSGISYSDFLRMIYTTPGTYTVVMNVQPRGTIISSNTITVNVQ